MARIPSTKWRYPNTPANKDSMDYGAAGILLTYVDANKGFTGKNELPVAFFEFGKTLHSNYNFLQIDWHEDGVIKASGVKVLPAWFSNGSSDNDWNLYEADQEDGKLLFKGLKAGGEIVISSYTTQMSVNVLSETNLEVEFLDNGACEVKLNGTNDGSFDVGFEKWDEETNEVNTMAITGDCGRNVSISYDGSADISGVKDISVTQTNGMAKEDLSVDVLEQSQEKKQDLDPTQSYSLDKLFSPETDPSDPEKPDKPSDPGKPESASSSVKISGISLSAISNKIAAGKTIQLNAVVLPKNATNKNLTWSSSNTKVATVTQNGKVTIKKGTGGKKVTITANATDASSKSATFQIKVMKGAVKKITIKGSKKTLKFGKNMKLKAIVKVTKGKPVNKKVEWTSSNPRYATVSSTGKVKALKAGKGKKVKIMAMATDGTGKKKAVTISIK